MPLANPNRCSRFATCSAEGDAACLAWASKFHVTGFLVERVTKLLAEAGLGPDGKPFPAGP